ncbi:hypothetical protein [Corynebacterium provencense]|uniref:hypothetical protein n=1 Tax=Corynebacterium provencense TaxID=1737425 RepID=UPI0011CBD4DC|nr:hypothetical protein [Corynebacterium provencense]
MSVKKRKRRGTPPNSGAPQDPGRVFAPTHDPRQEYPVLSFRFLEKGWDFEELSDEQCREFVCKWQKRSVKTWRELSQIDRHNIGSEKLPKREFKPAIPERFAAEDKFMVFRHHGNLPMAGVKVDNVYYVIWIEKKYNELYNHG